MSLQPQNDCCEYNALPIEMHKISRNIHSVNPDNCSILQIENHLEHTVELPSVDGLS